MSSSTGYTFAEKALARAAGLPSVVAGQIVDARPDVALSHDNTAAIYTIFKKLGVTKVNIDNDGRLVWTRVHREFFRDHPEQFDFRPPGKTFVEEYANFIAHKNEKLGSAGQLDTVRASIKA